MSSINAMLDKLETIEDFKAYAEAQHKTIVKITKKLNQLEEENKSLKLKADKPTNHSVISLPEGLTDEEAICIMELAKLRAASNLGELTLEECRKVEIYVKTLKTVRDGSNKKDVSPTSNMSTDDLLKAMDAALSEEAANE